MLFFNYGSNLNKEQFAKRCPSATFVGLADLRGCRLTFAGYSGSWGGGVATVVPAEGSSVPGAVYELHDPDDLRTLDRREGFPTCYDCFKVTVHKRRNRKSPKPMEVYTYVKVDNREAQPTNAYLKRVAQGYKDHGLDIQVLAKAVTSLPSDPIPTRKPKTKSSPKGAGKGSKRKQGKRKNKRRNKGGNRGHGPIKWRPTPAPRPAGTKRVPAKKAESSPPPSAWLPVCPIANCGGSTHCTTCGSHGSHCRSHCPQSPALRGCW